MNKTNKKNTIQRLKLEIDIRDKIIGLLLRECVERKITLPDFIATPLAILYGKENPGASNE